MILYLYFHLICEDLSHSGSKPSSVLTDWWRFQEFNLCGSLTVLSRVKVWMAVETCKSKTHAAFVWVTRVGLIVYGHWGHMGWAEVGCGSLCGENWDQNLCLKPSFPLSNCFCMLLWLVIQPSIFSGHYHLQKSVPCPWGVRELRSPGPGNWFYCAVPSVDVVVVWFLRCIGLSNPLLVMSGCQWTSWFHLGPNIFLWSCW